MAHDPRLPFQRRLLPDGYGRALRAAREAQDRTRRDVAASVGIASRTLARIEREQQKPLWPTLDRLCDELHVSVSAIGRRWMRDSFDLPTQFEAAPGLGLRALRLSRGMTIVELSGMIDVSASTISRFERGLTASRLLARLEGGPGANHEDSNVARDIDAIAGAFGLVDASALRAACLAALSNQQSATG